MARKTVGLLSPEGSKEPKIGLHFTPGLGECAESDSDFKSETVGWVEI